MKKTMGRMNLPPSEWGPPAWKFLKSAAQACDAGSAEAYESFIRLLPEVLPCEMCREHARRYIEQNPVDVGDLVGWLDRFEDRVAEEKRRAGKRRGGPRGAVALLFALVLLVALLVWAAVATSA